MNALTELQAILPEDGRFVFLTGAGISAESGIPTFRGPEGFWSHGSRVYHPQELATWAAFSRDPQLVWPWYLWRRQRCHEAHPNAAHMALVELERELGDRFTLVTQNVDGLHGRAGNSPERTYEIHGNIDYYRCVNDCGPRKAVPELDHISRDGEFHVSWGDPLECTPCRAWMRPHVLWFDECYDEPNYRYQSAMEAISQADILVVVGTTGTTSLPAHMLQIASMRGIPVVDINPEDNPFARTAMNGPGVWLQCSATDGMGQLLHALEGG